jgi:Sec-independent protein secretion pathway component TatC
VLQASWPAIAILVLAAVGLIRTETAVYLALVANAAILFVGGLALAHVAGARTLVMLAAGALTCALGVALVALKVAVH